jgi:hypothetical protein
MPQDIYGDGPLVYRRDGDNFILYSRGINFTDDGGKIIRDRRGRINNLSKTGDMVFWPRPKETQEEKEKRRKEMEQ